MSSGKTQKTHKGINKRIRKTGTGKLQRSAQGKRHLAACKSPKRRRQLRRERGIHATDRKRMERQYGAI